MLETLPPEPELAMAYSNLAQLRMLDHDLAGTLLWGNRAIALAEQFGDSETLIHARTNIGTARQNAGDDVGSDELTPCLRLALDQGLLDHAGRALTCLALSAIWNMRLAEAERWLATGIAFAIEHDHDFRHRYLLAARAALRFRQGAWETAELEARQVLGQPMLSPMSRMMALTALGHVHARRGHSDAAAALDEALTLAVKKRPAHASRAGSCRASRDGVAA